MAEPKKRADKIANAATTKAKSIAARTLNSVRYVGSSNDGDGEGELGGWTCRRTRRDQREKAGLFHTADEERYRRIRRFQRVFCCKTIRITARGISSHCLFRLLKLECDATEARVQLRPHQSWAGLGWATDTGLRHQHAVSRRPSSSRKRRGPTVPRIRL
jgi:hypothetical protein